MTALLLTVGSSQIWAQHNHGGGNHDHGQHVDNDVMIAPHGGMIKMSGKYHIEMVVNILQKKDKVTVYLLDKKSKTLPTTGVTGSVVFSYQDSTKTESELVVAGDHFGVELQKYTSFKAEVTIHSKGQTIKAKFEHGGLDMPMKGITYTCSMHPEISSDTQGSCPKCGMKLVKKK